MNTDLAGKVYIVTGGSRGFGLAIAKCLLGAGASVALLSRSRQSLDEAVTALGSERVLALECDVASSDSVNQAFDQVQSHFGHINGLVNNAGMAKPNRVEKLIESEVQQQVQTNFVGTVLCSQAAIPLLRGSDNPRIVNISSASAKHYDEMSHLSIYASTKAAVERFTRDLRTEVQGDGIGVSCVRPGAAYTAFSEGWDEQAIADGFAAWQHAGTYMDTGMEVEQVADAVLFTLSQPPGVAVDLLEVRPNIPMPKTGE